MREYDLGRSTSRIGQLYPVLLAADGSVIDGNHRVTVNKTWRSIRLQHIRSELDKQVARIVANTCRRYVSRKEKRGWVSSLAEELAKGGIERGTIAKKISELTGMSENWVYDYLPRKYKLPHRISDKNITKHTVVSEVREVVEDIVEEVAEIAREAPEEALAASTLVERELNTLKKQLASVRKNGEKIDANSVVTEIDTGFVFTCPVCHDKYHLIHMKPTNGHRFMPK